MGRSRGLSGAAALLLAAAILDAVASIPLPRKKVAKRKPVQWFHVHKAAGSTICALAKRMGERVIKPDGNCNSIVFHDEYNERFSKQRPSCLERRAHFKKHGFTWGAVETYLDHGTFCQDAFLNAMALREPIDRLESQVNYRVDEPYLEGPCRYDVLISHFKADNITLELQGECWRQLPAFDNYVTRLLGGFEVAVLPAGKVTQKHFEKAMATLELFDIVVPMEMLLSDPRVVLHLNHEFGWHLEPLDLRQRYNFAGTVEQVCTGHRTKFSEEQLRFLKHANRFDIALYDFAMERYKAKLDKLY